MTWSYDPTALEAALNWVRFRIGDTDTNDQQLSDEELNSLLAIFDDKLLAAWAGAKAISAKYARYGAAKEAEIYSMLADDIATELQASYL